MAATVASNVLPFRKVLMPPPVEQRHFAEDEVEAEIQRRIEARDRALRDAGINSQLDALRLEIQGHREDRVTKDDFTHGLEGLRDWISGNFINRADGFTPDQRLALQAVADNYIVSMKRQEHRRKWHETVWGRIGIAAGVLVASVQVLGFLATVFHWGR